MTNPHPHVPSADEYRRLAEAHTIDALELRADFADRYGIFDELFHEDRYNECHRNITRLPRLAGCAASNASHTEVRR